MLIKGLWVHGLWEEWGESEQMQGEGEVTKLRTQWGGRLDQNGTRLSTLQEIGSDPLQAWSSESVKGRGGGSRGTKAFLSCKIWGLARENYTWRARLGPHYVFLASQAENTPFTLAPTESPCRMGKGRNALETSGKLIRAWQCAVSYEKVKTKSPQTKGLQIWCESEAIQTVPAETLVGKLNFMWHLNNINQGEMVFFLGEFAEQF